MSGHGKNYRNAKASFDREHEYSPAEAVRLLKEMQTAKFDETIEVHFRLMPREELDAEATERD